MSKPMVSSQLARERLRDADTHWQAAMRAHEGYAERLRDLASAADEESRALTLAQLANIPWKPIPGASGLEPPVDLAKDGDRRGPAVVWKRFDTALADLGTALEGESIRTLAGAFEQLSIVVNELAAAAELAPAGQRKTAAHRKTS